MPDPTLSESDITDVPFNSTTKRVNDEAFRLAEQKRINEQKEQKRISEINSLAAWAQLIDWLDAENRRIAKSLHDAAFVYALYGALDGLSLSYSMVKYCFDLLYNNTSSSSSDMMHNWMMTPVGMAAVASESFLMIAYSILANIFQEDDQNAFKRYIAFSQPYLRDVMKGLKNAYKGIRSTLQAAGLLSGQDLGYLTVPLGLVLGILSAANRMWYRDMKDHRKAMQDANDVLLEEIMSRGGIDESVCDLLHNGYDYCFTSTATTTDTTTDTTIEENKLYFELKNGSLQYSVITPSGEKVTDMIIDEEIPGLIVNDPLNINKFSCTLTAPLTMDQLKPFLPDILRVTSAKKHTYRSTGIGQQSMDVRVVALLSAAYGGVIDGLYLNMGTMGIVVLVPPVFIAVLVLSIIFTLTCIATRIYEEYDYQRKLMITQAKVELALSRKKFEALFERFEELYATPLATPPSDDDVVYFGYTDDELVKPGSLKLTKIAKSLEQQRKDIIESLEINIEDLMKNHRYLESQVTLSYLSAVLAGLKNGLYAYSAIGSVMYAVATINTMLMILPISPFLLVGCVIAGIACLLGFMAYSLITTYLHRHHPDQNVTDSNSKFNTSLGSFKKALQDSIMLTPDYVANAKEDILGGALVDPSPQFFFQEWFEVVRSFFSGLGSKGQRSVEFATAGQHQDAPIMQGITILSSTVYAIGLGLRAYARGFNKPNPNNNPNGCLSLPDLDIKKCDVTELEHQEPSADRELGDGGTPQTDSPQQVCPSATPTPTHRSSSDRPPYDPRFSFGRGQRASSDACRPPLIEDTNLIGISCF